MTTLSMLASAMTRISRNHNVALLLLVLTCSLQRLGVAGKVHTSIENRLGDGQSLTLHCQSKDNDLGQQTVTDGSEFGWDFSVNPWGTTLFYCDMSWDTVPQFSFNAFDFGRDFARCQSQCLWVVAKEGMYMLNGETGFWEFAYQWSIS